MFGTGETSGVVGQCGTGELVFRKVLAHRGPPGDAFANVALGQCPQMPSGPILRIRFLGALGQFTDHVRSATGEPVGVCERHQGFGITWPLRGDMLVDRNHDFGPVLEGVGCGNQVVRCCGFCQAPDGVHEGAEVVVRVVSRHGSRKRVLEGGHTGKLCGRQSWVGC